MRRALRARQSEGRHSDCLAHLNAPFVAIERGSPWLLPRIHGMGPDDDLYDAKVTVLGEYIDHHVQEEEGEMFPKCRRAKMDLAGLAASLAERKSELMAEVAA